MFGDAAIIPIDGDPAFVFVLVYPVRVRDGADHIAELQLILVSDLDDRYYGGVYCVLTADETEILLRDGVPKKLIDEMISKWMPRNKSYETTKVYAARHFETDDD